MVYGRVSTAINRQPAANNRQSENSSSVVAAMDSGAKIPKVRAMCLHTASNVDHSCDLWQFCLNFSKPMR